MLQINIKIVGMTVNYWIGSDNKENRTLELKWMAPMFIHKDDVHEDA